MTSSIPNYRTQHKSHYTFNKPKQTTHDFLRNNTRLTLPIHTVLSAMQCVSHLKRSMSKNVKIPTLHRLPLSTATVKREQLVWLFDFLSAKVAGATFSLGNHSLCFVL